MARSKGKINKRREINRLYALLERHFGDLGWWPADSAFEVMVGAILTQNTSWVNVEKAIGALRAEDLMCPSRIADMRTERLALLVRPSGYYRQKAGRLKEFSRFIMDECGGDLRVLRRRNTASLRRKLLSVKGIGPETADSILLYSLGKAVFVVDTYTRRIFSRHGLVSEAAACEELQDLVEDNFTGDRKALNQFHALLVETGKRFCRKRDPLCGECPLGVMLKNRRKKRGKDTG